MDVDQVTIRRGTVDEMSTELESMISAHAAELNLDEPAVLWQIFKAVEADERLVIDIAESDGGPVGYCVMVVGPDQFFCDKVFARILAVYLDPEVRGHGVGIEMIQNMMTEAVERDADYLSVHMPGQRSDRLMYRLGFDFRERHYMMRLN